MLSLDKFTPNSLRTHYEKRFYSLYNSKKKRKHVFLCNNDVRVRQNKQDIDHLMENFNGLTRFFWHICSKVLKNFGAEYYSVSLNVLSLLALLLNFSCECYSTYIYFNCVPGTFDLAYFFFASSFLSSLFSFLLLCNSLVFFFLLKQRCFLGDVFEL